MNDAVEGHISLDDLENVVSWNYFRRDHLGNNVAVWKATADSTIRRQKMPPLRQTSLVIPYLTTNV